MFGAVCAYLFDFILGIKREGYEGQHQKITISPSQNTGLGYAKGHIKTINGNIYVEYNTSSDKTRLTVEIPKNTEARIHLPDGDKLIKNPGKFEFSY